MTKTQLSSLRNRYINKMRQSQIGVKVAVPAPSLLTGYSPFLPTPVALRCGQLVLGTVSECVTDPLKLCVL